MLRVAIEYPFAKVRLQVGNGLPFIMVNNIINLLRNG